MDNDKIQEKSRAAGKTVGLLSVSAYRIGREFVKAVKKQIDEANLKEYEEYKEIKENLKDLNK